MRDLGDFFSAHRSQNVLLLLLLLFCLNTKESVGQCKNPVGLHEWKMVGATANGQWVVHNDGSSVRQLINGKPTFFVSPQEYINVKITGNLKVDSTSWDDDFIGFVFGYKTPSHLYDGLDQVKNVMLDWKKETQTSGEEGFSLVRVNGEFDFTNDSSYALNYWTHNESNKFTILDSKNGPGTGWEAGKEYFFEINYGSQQMQVILDGDTIFDVMGCFEPGRFGFYNYSQNEVTYSNFSYELMPDFIRPDRLCSGSDGNFRMLGHCATDSLLGSVIQSVNWNFGDGTNSNDWNPVHGFAQDGAFPVTLTVMDAFGCKDSISKVMNVSAKSINADFSWDQGCEGKPTVFEDFSLSNITNIQSWKWYIDSNDQADFFTPNFEHVFPKAGTYSVTLRVDDLECFDTQTQEIEVASSPLIQFESDVQTANDENAEIQFFNYSEGAVRYLWDFGDQNQSEVTDPVHSYGTEGVFDVTLTGWNDLGCVASDTLPGYITVQPGLYAPNLFSPNQDGQNDQFRIRGEGIVGIELRIFNQWGEMIALIEDPELGWDGTSKGAPVEQGTYVYSGEVFRNSEKRVRVQGHITLIR